MPVTGPLGIEGALARVREISSLTTPTSPPPTAPPQGGEFTQALLRGALGTPSPTTAAPGLPIPGATAPTILSADDAALAARLDAWMAEKVPGSPLVGKGAVFVQEGRAAGVDPRALVAIARHESALGTLGSGRDIHNAFGWGPAIPFDSWEENIATVARGLREGYLDEGRVTIATIQPKWAPVGAGNDPTNLNSNWTRAVSISFGELGGDPNASLALAPTPRISA